MKLPYWRFFLPMALQLGILFSIAFVPLSIVLTGTTVILQTIAFDPYDILRGYSQVLNYEFGLTANLRELPGGKSLRNGSEFYLIFAAPENPNSVPPQPWKPTKIMDNLPPQLPPNQIAIRGRVENEFRVVYGIEELYIPEDQRDKINRQVEIANTNQAGAVEVKVGRSGQAVLRGLWLGSTRLEF